MSGRPRQFTSGQDLVYTCNDMLSRMHVPRRVNHWSEINTDIFVTLYEGVCGEVLPDKIPNSRSREDDVHNCQAVIDSLSLDVLNTTLSHITGDDIVSGNKTAINNLLGVFQGLMEYLLDKIESSIDNDDIHNETVHSEDPDMVTADVIDSILERELGNNRSRNGSQLRVSWEDTNRRNNLSGKSSRRKDVSAGDGLESTAELIKLGDSYSLGSDNRGKRSGRENGNLSSSRLRDTYPRGSFLSGDSRRPPELNGSADYLSRSAADISSARDPSYTGYSADNSGLRDSTTELIKESEQIRKRIELSDLARSKKYQSDTSAANASVASSVVLPEPVAPGATSGDFDQLGMRPRTDDTRPLSASLREVNPLSASLPIAPVSSLASLTDVLPLANTNSNASGGLEFPHTGPSTEFPASNGGSSGEQNSRLGSTAPSYSGYRYTEETGRSKSFENLHTLMQDTVAMSRQALNGSPLRETHSKTTSRSRDDRLDEELSEALRSSIQLRGPDSIVESQSFKDTSVDDSERKLQSILSPSKRSTKDFDSKRKVSFKTNRSPRNKKSSPAEKTSPPKSSNTRRDIVASPSNKRPSRTNKRMKSDAAEKQSNVMAETFHDYLLKYYGKDHRVPLESLTESDGDGYRSDGDVEYNDNRKDPDFGTELKNARDELMRKAKAVKFDDILDDSAPGRMGSIRRKLKDEDINTRYKAEFLNKVYADELMDYEEEIEDFLAKPRKDATDKEKEYKKKVLVGPKTSKYKPPKKYSGGSVLIARPSRPKAKGSKGRKRSASASPTLVRSAPKSIYDSEILPWLLEEFPYLHLSSESLQELWKKSSRQIEQLSKAENAVNSKKTKAQRQMEEAERRQKILLDIMRKELAHNQRLKDIKERQKLSQSVKSKMREKRQQSARCRKYYDEYQVRMRAKMLKKRNKEEMIFKKLFKDGLDIQKDRIRELRKYAKEQREARASKQQNELESLENYYRDQFSMLADAMHKEKEELNLREKAQDKVVHQMRKELRNKMETEIKTFQEQLYRDEDDAYWRDLDAERLRHELHLAKYKTKV